MSLQSHSMIVTDLLFLIIYKMYSSFVFVSMRFNAYAYGWCKCLHAQKSLRQTSYLQVTFATLPVYAYHKQVSSMELFLF